MLDSRPARRIRRRVDGPRKARTWPLYLMALVGLAVVGLMVAGGSIVARKARGPKISYREQAIKVAHAFIRQTLRPGLQAAFAGDEETTVETLPGNKTMISGWVDVVSAEGRADRQSYSLAIYQSPGGGWMGENITVMPSSLAPVPASLAKSQADGAGSSIESTPQQAGKPEKLAR